MAAKKKTATRAVSGTVENVDGDGVVTMLPATISPAFDASDIAKSVIVKKQVTVPTLPWPDDSTIVFTPIDAIRQGKELKGTRGGKANFGPAKVMTIKAPDGTLRQLIVGAVLEGELTENYPENGYVNRWFMAKKIAPNAEKQQRYATYQIAEIEPPRGND